uniref:Uncharacterized protein n=1 Tax=Anguilla anguilla TaxID=7936 RepID=A0A0E9RVG5_ANGAN
MSHYACNRQQLLQRCSVVLVHSPGSYCQLSRLTFL